jgi:hypothetical protein
MGCPETSVMRLPDNHNQAARDALVQRQLEMAFGDNYQLL